MVGVLRILRDPYQTSSHFSLELYSIGWLLCKTNHSLLILISLIPVIFVFELLTPCTFPVYLSAPFLISTKLITYQRVYKRGDGGSAISAQTPVNCAQQQ